MTRQGGYCSTGGYTMQGVYVSQGMVLHCLLNTLVDKKERRGLGEGGFGSDDNITDIVS